MDGIYKSLYELYYHHAKGETIKMNKQIYRQCYSYTCVDVYHVRFTLTLQNILRYMMKDIPSHLQFDEQKQNCQDQIEAPVMDS